MSPSPAAPTKQPSKRRRRWAGWILLILIVVLGFFVVRGALRLRATPTYWTEHQTFLRDTPERDIQHLAKDIQSRTLREWSYPIGDGDGVRTVRYQFDEANAWLATRLGPMLENQNLVLPDELGQFMLTQRDGDLVLAFDYRSDTLGQRIASLYFMFEPQADGPLQAGIRAAKAGEQSLGVKYLVDAVADQPALDDPEVQRLLNRLGKKWFVDLPTIPVDDHRHATVLDIAIAPEGVDLTIRVAYNDDEETSNEQ